MPVSYIGGKSRISSFIIPYIPKDIETYVEPFSGAFWVFFKMDISKYEKLKDVVYNDVNKLNVNLINCSKDYENFSKIIDEIPSQKRELFNQYQKELFSPDLNIDTKVANFELAYKYAYILTQCWSGTNPEKSKFIDLKGKYKSKFDTFKSKLKDNNWRSHFDKITIVENEDFSTIFQKYDSPTTYFYCDPPYKDTEKYYSNHSFNSFDHQRLSVDLKKINGKFSLSYYDFKELSEFFPKDEFKWTSKYFSKPSMAKSGVSQTKGNEILIMNY
jgi:DNA adenine methylase